MKGYHTKRIALPGRKVVEIVYFHDPSAPDGTDAAADTGGPLALADAPYAPVEFEEELRTVLRAAARLARTEKIASGTTKLALRTAMGEVLPRTAAERAKLGFPVPIGHWLKGGAYGFAEQLLRDAQTEEWIDRQQALRLLQGYRSGQPGIEWRDVGVLIVFSLWHRIYVEAAYAPVALGWEHPARVSR